MTIQGASMKTRNGAFWGISGGVLASICGCSVGSGGRAPAHPGRAGQTGGGPFGGLALSDTKPFPKLLDVPKPLRAPSAPKPLIEELLDRQLVDPTQAEFNRKIVREYHLAVMP